MAHETTVPETGVVSGSATSLAEWRQLAGSRFVPLRVTADRVDRFEAVLRSRRIDGACVSEITANPHRVQRTPALIALDDPRHFKLSLQLDGVGFVAQDGREALLRPGDIAIYDTGRPYTIDFTEDVRCLVMAFPQSDFDVPSKLIERITAVRLRGDTGVGAVISPFMQHIAENLHQLSGINGERIFRSSLDLLTTLVYAQLTDGDHDRVQSHRDEIHAFKRHIDTHLEDPGLCVAGIARDHFISVRSLQYLFQEEGLTVSGYIRGSRLEHCRMDLSDPAQTSLSVSQIAQRRGFVDASHFSKVFRAQFGESPREFRNRRLVSSAPGTASAAQWPARADKTTAPSLGETGFSPVRTG